MDTPQPSPSDVPKRVPRQMHEVFSPLEIKLLSQIQEKAGGFQLLPMPGATPDQPAYATISGRKIILYNDTTIDTWSRYRVFACFAHELGHHFPDVVAFQDQCDRLVPAAMGILEPLNLKNPKKLVYSVINVLADVLLESTIPMHREVTAGDLFAKCFRQNRGDFMLDGDDISSDVRETFVKTGYRDFPWKEILGDGMTNCSQYLNLYLIGSFFDFPEKSLVSPEVASLYPDASDIVDQIKDSSRSGEGKALLLIKVTQHLKQLLESDFEKLKACEDPYASKAAYEKILEGELEKVDAATEPMDHEGDPSQVDEKDPTPQSHAAHDIQRKQRDAIRRAMGEVGEGSPNDGTLSIEDIKIAEVAKQLEVRPETYRRFLEICSTYQALIERLTQTLAKFVLQQFSMVPHHHQRSGPLVTPGRQVETYLRHRGGDPTPPTKTNRLQTRDPKTLQLYTLIDTSGSMSAQLEGTLAYYTILTVAAMKIREELQNNALRYNLKSLQYLKRDPLEIEITGFDNEPLILVPFTGKIDLKTLAQGFEHIIDRTSRGGVTNDAEALKYQHQRMRERKDQTTLKILSMITDGYGDFLAATREKIDEVQAIIREIEDDPSIYFLVNGVGSGAQAVQEAYLKLFRPAKKYHVYAHQSPTVQEAIPHLIAFLEKQIEEHFSSK